jgi:hypothetical protein
VMLPEHTFQGEKVEVVLPELVLHMHLAGGYPDVFEVPVALYLLE